ncbi:MAG: hypothetical protein JW809_12385 [Pirellulales bacterium]|nr:hypothetical protein [Pirellulales bacterium]
MRKDSLPTKSLGSTTAWLSLMVFLGLPTAAPGEAPRNADELRTAMAALHKTYAPYLRSFPAPLAARSRQAIGPAWRSRFEVRRATDGTVPEPPAWFAPDFDDSAWEAVDLPEWRYEAVGPREAVSCIAWYRAQFPAAPTADGKRAVLVFEGVDWEAQVWLNGQYLGAHRGYYEPFQIDVTPLLAERNVLAVRVIDGPKYGEPVAFWSLFTLAPAARQRYTPGAAQSVPGHRGNDVLVGSGYGIHRDVYLETTGDPYIEEVFVRGYPERGKTIARVEVRAAAPCEATLAVEVLPENFEGQPYLAERTCALPAGPSEQAVTIDVPEAMLWSPDAPNLYRCRVTIERAGETVDGKDALFGYRSLAMVSPQNPREGLQEGTLLLNGRPIFLRGTSVNGLNELAYWGQTDQLLDVLLMLKAAHFNAVRSCQHVCGPEVRELMDRLGIMSEQDQGGGRNLTAPAASAQMTQTGTTLARACYNNPGVVVLSFANECRFDPTDVIRAALAFDPDRIIAPISGHPHGGNPQPYEGTTGYDLPDEQWARVIDNFHAYRGWYAMPGEIWNLSKRLPPGRMILVGEYGVEALDGYDTMARHYPAHFKKTPPPEADTLWGHVQVEKASRPQITGFRGRRPANLGQYIEASQTYQADACTEVTKAWRLSPRRIAGYFHFHFIDVLPASWPKSIVSHDCCPKKAYFAMAQVNQPLVPLLEITNQGKAMELWLANDLPRPVENAQLHWEIRDAGKPLAGGAVPAVVPASDARRVAEVDISAVPDAAEVVTVKLLLVDSKDEVLAQYEQELFLRAWRQRDQIWSAATASDGPAAKAPTPPPAMKLWKEIDLAAWRGSFVSPGDLDGDGNVDFLLSQMGPYTTPARLIAVNLEGKKLWEVGSETPRTGVSGVGREPTCRGIASVVDVDGDGRAEALAELWEEDKPWLVLLEGKTGKVRRRIPSPLDMSVRKPEGFRGWRPVPMALIVHLDGADAPPTIVLKYEASNTIPTHAVGLDSQLNVLWRHEMRPTAMGHIPTVADLDGDGREEVVLGETALGQGGKILWQRDFGIHADCTAVADLADSPGREVLVSICQKGPMYCLSARGDTLWKKSREDVPHGQAVWTGDFLPDRPGTEVIVLRSGHIGDFLTLSGTDGGEIARFQHEGELHAYPDFPVAVHWTSPDTSALWVPVDRRLVDGRGHTVANLGSLDKHVVARLGSGASKQALAPQAIAVDLRGDARQELIVYQPYAGQAVFVFTQPDSDAKPKPYAPQPSAYHARTYF